MFTIPGNDASILCDNGNKITISKSKALQKLVKETKFNAFDIHMSLFHDDYFIKYHSIRVIYSKVNWYIIIDQKHVGKMKYCIKKQKLH